MFGNQGASFLKHLASETYCIVLSVVMTMEKVFANAAYIADNVLV
jgi:hypothetical protein